MAAELDPNKELNQVIASSLGERNSDNMFNRLGWMAMSVELSEFLDALRVTILPVAEAIRDGLEKGSASRKR